MEPQGGAPVPIGRVFATFDVSAEAEGWLETQNAWYAQDDGQPLLREFSRLWAEELVEAFSDEFRQRNLPIQVEVRQTVEGSLLHIAYLIWEGAQHAWPYVQGTAEAIGAADVLLKAGRRVKRRLRRRANIDAHNAIQPTTPAPPPQVIVEVHVVVEVRRLNP